MTSARDLFVDPRVQAAILEIQSLILARFPDATFDLAWGEDPEGIYLRPIVDVDDRSGVIDSYIERLVELQIEDGLPIFVVPGRPVERNAAILRARTSPATTAVASL